MACERTSETIKIESQEDRKVGQVKKIERLVNGQDVFLFQPTGSRKFESFAASGTSYMYNQSTKTKHWAQETKQSVK